MMQPRITVPRRAQFALFARNFLRHPRMLGSAIPSSRFLVNEALGCVDWARARVIVEYGPGVGNFTVEILRRMRPDAHLIAIEMNADFVEFLKREITDPRLTVVNASAAEVVDVLTTFGHDRADCIISGIPFSTMPRAIREAILCASRDALGPDGVFLVYQFSSRVFSDLKRMFGTVERRFEPLNILPAQLFVCTPDGRPPASEVAG